VSDWTLVKSIFEQAVEAPPGQRSALLERLSDGDAALRGRVEALLAAHADAGTFLEAPTLASELRDLPPAAAGEALGAEIGPYRLVEIIGEGGFGTVYRAEQQEPVRRTVALKVLKPGMDTREVVRRFEAERHALALMEHPNIARALDAGATPAGRPYFVMELAEGAPITDYCDQRRLDLPARLRLMIDVCHAVQHAHQKGIIHRDIKPSNVLVAGHDGRPAPKVIDFGIAKAIDQRLRQQTLMTAVAQLIGTPAYMSPEQARLSGGDIDTRADIYSLGVPQALKRRAQVGEVGRHQRVLLAVLASQQRFAEAEPLYREALEINRARFGPRNPAGATTLDNLAFVLAQTDRVADAEALYREALENRLALFGQRHRDVAYTQHNLAHLLHYANPATEETEPLLRAALTTLRDLYGLAHNDTLTVVHSLASVYGAHSKLDEAAALMLEAYAACAASAETPDAQRRRLAARLAELYQAVQKPELSAEWQAKAASTEHP